MLSVCSITYKGLKTTQRGNLIWQVLLCGWTLQTRTECDRVTHRCPHAASKSSGWSLQVQEWARVCQATRKRRVHNADTTHTAHHALRWHLHPYPHIYRIGDMPHQRALHLPCTHLPIAFAPLALGLFLFDWSLFLMDDLGQSPSVSPLVGTTAFPALPALACE